MAEMKNIEVRKNENIISLEDLDIRVSELRDEELMARPVNHVGH
ncbi:hypothetical protein ACIQYG_22070 [Peribacillus sp. NPDC096622]